MENGGEGEDAESELPALSEVGMGSDERGVAGEAAEDPEEGADQTGSEEGCDDSGDEGAEWEAIAETAAEGDTALGVEHVTECDEIEEGDGGEEGEEEDEAAPGEERGDGPGDEAEGVPEQGGAACAVLKFLEGGGEAFRREGWWGIEVRLDCRGHVLVSRFRREVCRE